MRACTTRKLWRAIIRQTTYCSKASANIQATSASVTQTLATGLNYNNTHAGHWHTPNQVKVSHFDFSSRCPLVNTGLCVVNRRVGLLATISEVATAAPCKGRCTSSNWCSHWTHSCLHHRTGHESQVRFSAGQRKVSSVCVDHMRS